MQRCSGFIGPFGYVLITLINEPRRNPAKGSSLLGTHSPALDAASTWRALKSDQQAQKLHPDAMLFFDSPPPELVSKNILVTTDAWPQKQGIRLDTAPADGDDAGVIANALRKQMVADHEALGLGMISGRLAVDGDGKVIPDPPSQPRDPCLGFLNISYDVVVSMMEKTQCGTWAFFGGPYGADIMHFDTSSSKKYT